MGKKTFRGPVGRWASLLAALALVVPAAACGPGGDTLLWTLDGGTLIKRGYLRTATWATGEIFAVTREREVTGYDAATGRRRWTAPLSGAVCAGSAHASGSVAVVLYGRTRHFCENAAAIDLRNGAKVWEQPVIRDGRRSGGQVVIAADTAVVDWLYGTAAFDLRTGRPLWRADDGDADCAYDRLVGGPALVAGRTCDADKGAVRGAYGIDPRSGRVLWTYDAPPGHEIYVPLSSRPAVLGLDAGSRSAGARRVVVLDEAGGPLADFDPGATIRCPTDDRDLCEHVVVTGDTLYLPSGAGSAKKEVFAPVVAFDLATGRARWRTDNPDGNHLFPVALDGGRLIAAQPGTAGYKGRGKPPRLVSVDPATGRTKIMWELTRKADFPIRSGSRRQYAGGRFFLAKSLVTGKEDAAVRAYGLDERKD